MKKILVVGIWMCLLASCTNRATIQFVRDKSFPEIQEMAQTSNKAIFLYVWATGNSIDSVFRQEVFNDEAIYTYFNENFINYSINSSEDRWSDVVRHYGLSEYPTLLMLTPQAELITDIIHLGQIGYDEMGNLPCRRPFLRQAEIASAYMNCPTDSAFFIPAIWNKIDQSYVRLDSKLFERIIANKEFLKQRYNKGFDVLIDFSMSAAAVSLVVNKKGQAPYRNEYRIKSYYDALDRYEIDNEARYKLYADVNIAYGMDDNQQALRVADEAFRTGVISESEYRQLKYSLER